MTFLPIADRELRVAARRRMTYRTRQVTVLVALLLTAWTLIIARRWAAPTRMGQDLFHALSVFAFVYCLLAGLRTSDALSEEKREGTLGLLFLTDLKGHDVLLGKLLSHSLHFFYGLLATLPVLSLPMLVGGVTWGNFGRMALVLINTLLFSLVLGLWVSSRSQHGVKALAGTLLIVAFFTGMLPWLGSELKDEMSAPNMHPAFYWPSPGFSFALVMDNVATVRPMKGFWPSVFTVHGLAWFFLVWTAMRIPRAWQDRALDSKAAEWQARMERWSFGSPRLRASQRRHALERNPIVWLDDRYRLQKTAVWMFLLIFATVWLWYFSENPRRWFTAPILIFTGMIWHGVLKIWLALQATRRFAEDRRSGALELLLVTPLSVGEIVRGHCRALIRQFGWPIAAVVIADFLLSWGQHVLLSDAWWASTPWIQTQKRLWLLTCATGIIVFLVDACTISWLGPWLSLKCRSHFHAAFLTIFLILVLPWALVGGTMAIASWLAPRLTIGETVLTILWFSVGIMIDVICLLWARKKILREFRLAAAQQYGSERARDRWTPFRLPKRAVAT
jgi:ABC-type transport system involved in cytochrome c biogenesis permease component